MYQHIKIIDGLDIKMLIWTFHVNRQSNRCARQWAQQIDLICLLEIVLIQAFLGEQ